MPTAAEQGQRIPPFNWLQSVKNWRQRCIGTPGDGRWGSRLRGGAVSRNEARRRAIEALDLVEQIRPILATRDEDVQSAALAELLALWIAGHTAGPPGQTVYQWREELLQKHIELVRKLIVPSETERGAS